MQIATLLLTPSLRQLDHEFSVLTGQISENRNLDTCQILQDIHSCRNQIQALFEIVSREVCAPSPSAYDRFRHLKLEYRLLSRRWLKMLSNAERVKKMIARRTDVAAVAA